MIDYLNPDIINSIFKYSPIPIFRYIEKKEIKLVRVEKIEPGRYCKKRKRGILVKRYSPWNWEKTWNYVCRKKFNLLDHQYPLHYLNNKFKTAIVNKFSVKIIETQGESIISKYLIKTGNDRVYSCKKIHGKKKLLLKNVKKISSGTDYRAILTRNGKLFMEGRNNDKQLGIMSDNVENRYVRFDSKINGIYVYNVFSDDRKLIGLDDPDENDNEDNNTYKLFQLNFLENIKNVWCGTNSTIVQTRKGKIFIAGCTFYILPNMVYNFLYWTENKELTDLKIIDVFFSERATIYKTESGKLYDRYLKEFTVSIGNKFENILDNFSNDLNLMNDFHKHVDIAFGSLENNFVNGLDREDMTDYPSVTNKSIIKNSNIDTKHCTTLEVNEKDKSMLLGEDIVYVTYGDQYSLLLTKQGEVYIEDEYKWEKLKLSEPAVQVNCEMSDLQIVLASGKILVADETAEVSVKKGLWKRLNFKNVLYYANYNICVLRNNQIITFV